MRTFASYGPRRAIAWCAFGSVCLAPFLFASVTRREWIGLCQLWMGLGLAWWLLPKESTDAGLAVSKALLPLHVLLAVQLIPIPAVLLRWLSAGAFAVHFIPNPGDGRFRPLTVSSSATIEAWIYVAGLHGLFLALQGLPARRRRGFAYALLGVILLLAVQGLWQSRSAHPYWLLGLVPVYLPPGLDTTIFGPYLNRNHFATVMAMGAGMSAGAATALVMGRGTLARLLADPLGLPRVILLTGSCAFLVIAGAASGSRSGTLAALIAVAVLLTRAWGKRFLAVGVSVFALGFAGVVLTGAASIDRLLNLDLMTSRITPWADMTTLFRFFPLFGAGIGAFGEAYLPYQTNATYEIWPHAHNDYLQWLIEAGLAGLVVLFLLVSRLRRSVVFSPETREMALGAGIAFAGQAALDFPCRVLANAALLVCVLALSTKRKENRLTGLAD